MFTRVTALVQMVALLACPLWCAQGLCHAGAACAGGNCALEIADQAPVCVCCCEDVASSEEVPNPERCPDESECQGICGGAVVERTIELDAAELSFLPPATDKDACSALGYPHFIDHVDPPRLPANNFGRFVRMLRGSFLC